MQDIKELLSRCGPYINCEQIAAIFALNGYYAATSHETYSPKLKVDFLKERGGTLTVNYEISIVSKDEKTINEIIRINDSTILCFEVETKVKKIDFEKISAQPINAFTIASEREEDVLEFLELARKHLSKSRKIANGEVYMIGVSEGTIVLSSVNRPIISKFIEENYSKEVAQKHKFIVDNISKKEPQGRIVIYQGVPGTGKTYAIKNLISETRNCFTILIPPGMIKNLSDPNFVPMLLQINRYNLPILFILEDADEVLEKRSKENIQSLSNLLNMGDGILGSILDTRIIASTNAPIQEFDEAVMRPGRLLEFIKFENLSAQEAAVCIRKINPEIDEESLPTEPASLARCYEIARRNLKGKTDGNSRNKKNNKTTKKLYH